MARWFRMHADVRENEKIQALNGDNLRHWLNLMCVAAETDDKGFLPSLERLAIKIRLSPDGALEVLNRMISLRLVDSVKERFRMHDWNDWQYESDRSSNRVKAFRKRQENVSETEVERSPSVSVSVSGSVVGGVGEGFPREPYKIMLGKVQAMFRERWGEEFEDWYERQYIRHPKKKDKQIGQQCAVEKIVDERLNPVVFEERHKAWCSSEDWKWKGGAKAPTLAQWILDDGWLYDPPRPEAEGDEKKLDSNKFNERGEPRRMM